MDQLRRRIVYTFIDVIMLARLKVKPSLSGYDFIQFIHKEHKVLMSSGKIYSVLYRLERRGLLRGSYDHRRRVYSLTEEGRKRIETVQNHVEEILKLFKSVVIGR